MHEEKSHETACAAASAGGRARSAHNANLSIKAIIALGAWLNTQGLASVGDIVTFMSFATLLIDRLQGSVSFVNRIFMETPRLEEFFAVLDTTPAIRDKRGAVDPPPLRGRNRHARTLRRERFRGAHPERREKKRLRPR